MWIRVTRWHHRLWLARVLTRPLTKEGAWSLWIKSGSAGRKRQCPGLAVERSKQWGPSQEDEHGGGRGGAAAFIQKEDDP